MNWNWFRRPAPERRRGKSTQRRARSALLGVRRLERRRVLDASLASITSLTLPPVISEGDLPASATANGLGTIFFDWSLKQDGAEIDSAHQSALAGQQVNANLTLPDDNQDLSHAYTLELKVSDAAQTFDVETRTLDVMNVAPTVELSGNSSVDEGSPYSLTIAPIVDPGADTVTQYSIDWGDGNVEPFTAAEVDVFGRVVTHTFADGVSNPTIKIGLTDEDGVYADVDTLALTVNNVAPTVELSGNASAEVSTSYNLMVGPVVDPGADTVSQYTVHWGDGQDSAFTAAALDAAGRVVSHTYSSGPVQRTISIDLVDEDGSYVNVDALNLNVVLPPVTITDVQVPPVIHEGDLLGVTATADGFGTLFFDWSLKDNGVEINSFHEMVPSGQPKTSSFNFTVPDDNQDMHSIVVELKVTDSAQSADFLSQPLDVLNVAPTVKITGNSSVNAGTSYELAVGSVVDPGTDTVSQYTVHWGDGQTSVLTAQQLDDAGRIVTHTYTTGPSQQTISIDLADEDGTYLNVDSLLLNVLVQPATITDIQIPPVIHEGDSLGATATADGFGTLFFDWSLKDNGVEIDSFHDVVMVGQPKTSTFNFTVPDDNEDMHSIVVELKVTDSAQTSDFESRSLTVLNVAPTLLLSGNANVDEGSLYSLMVGPVVDPGTDTVSQYLVHWGDGQSDVYTAAEVDGAGRIVTHTYADGPSSPTITIDLTDEDGAYLAVDSLDVTVNNVAPVVELSGDATVDEGSLYSLTIGPAVDPGADTVSQYTVHWGDGETNVYTAAEVNLAGRVVTHTYPDGPANPTITIDLTDEDGAYLAVDSLDVTVNNVAPIVELRGNASVDEGATYSLTIGPLVDPGADTVTQYAIHWGDGATQTFSAAEIDGLGRMVSHTYADGPSSPTITVDLADEDGTYLAVDSLEVTVNNVAPIVALSGNTSVDEGSLYSLTIGPVIDPGTDTVTQYAVHWGDGQTDVYSAAEVDGAGRVVTHTYADGPSNPTITIDLLDEDGTYPAVDSLDVIVNNVAPVVVLSGNASVDEGSFYSLTIGPVLDPGADTVAQYTIHWGDGQTDVYSAAEVDGAGRIVTHTYADGPSSPTITIDLTDEDGTYLEVDSLDVTVNNVAPIVVLSGNASVDEGSLYSLTIGPVVDPGTDTIAQYTVHWGDGQTNVYSAAEVDEAGRVVTHTYADGPSTPMIKIDLVDEDGAYLEVDALTVAVNNVLPGLSVVDLQTVDEGSLLTLTNLGSITDPGFADPQNPSGATAETFTYYIDWNDGTAAVTGSATIDQLGSVGIDTAASFDGSHIFADNGTYKVVVRVADDDMSANFTGGEKDVDFIEMTFTVVVNNVDPVLTGLDTPPIVNEGEAFVLSNLGSEGTKNLGIGLSDPGFDNPANAGNASNGGEFEETFTGMSIDWGDGSAVTAVNVVNRVSGSEGVLTTAQFDHVAHTYADNGVYTVSVTFSDDDGEPVTRTFTIEVKNVAPTLTLTSESFVINEGDTLSLPNLGSFTDPGFNNPNNPLSQPGGSQETFTYSIDWGDGTAVEKLQLPSTTMNGAPGLLTSGTLVDSHLYADNDADNIYTITVTLTDDDGGSDTKSFQITVHNVNPTLQPVAATDVESSGKTTLQMSFSDPGADTFQILIDWGDKPDLPPEQRFVVETVHAGPTPASFTLVHVYTGPPDPLHPTADITIRVKVFDDDAIVEGVVQPGISNLESVTISNPGINTNMVAIDTTPDVPRLSPAPPAATGVFIPPQAAATQATQVSQINAASGETTGATDRYLRLCVIQPDGRPSKCFRIKDEALYDLRGFFATLPDNRYQVFVVRTESNSQRLVIEVNVRRGQLVDPTDETEGTRDRPPTSEAPVGGAGNNVVPLEQNPLLQQGPEPAGAVNGPLAPIPDSNRSAGPLERAPVDGHPLTAAEMNSSQTEGACASVAAMGIVAWSKRVDAALATADERAWQRLRRAARLGRLLQRA